MFQISFICAKQRDVVFIIEWDYEIGGIGVEQRAIGGFR